MRTWVRYTLIGVGIAVLGIAILSGVGGYYFLRHLETRQTTEAAVTPEFDAVHARFANRPAMIEAVDPKRGDIRVQRVAHPEGRRADTLHVLTWGDGQMIRTNVPLWLTRFSSVNVLSNLGVIPTNFQLTFEDLERFGPGLVIDYRQAGQTRVLIWLE